MIITTYQPDSDFQMRTHPSYYKNPFSINEIGDPYVVTCSNGLYYLFATSGLNGYYCWRSTDLVHWTDKTLAFERTSDNWCKSDFWAPEVIEWNDIYYMFYTARNENHSLRIGLATSLNPYGPYKEALYHPLFDPGYAVIDANVLLDGEDKYLYFSRDCSENIVDNKRQSQIYGVKLAPDMKSIEGEPVLLLTPDQPWELASFDTLWNEGPEMIKHGDIYYLTYSANCFASSSYSIGYATSQYPLKNFVKASENPILFSGSYQSISGPGHHSFAWSPDKSELFFIYHTHTDPEKGGGNRQVNIDRAVFLSDGKLHVNGPTTAYLPLPSNTQIYIEDLAAFSNNDTVTLLLNDKIFTVHEKDQLFDFTIPTDSEGNAVITAEFKKTFIVNGFSIFKGSNADYNFESVSIRMDDMYEILPITASDKQEERCINLCFEPKQVKKIDFTLQSKNPNSKISISEIMIISYNNQQECM